MLIFEECPLPQFPKGTPSLGWRHNGVACVVLEMSEAAADAGLEEFEGLAGSGREKAAEKHASRNLRRRLMRTRGWPTAYKAWVPTWSQKERKVVEKEMSFALPHAILATLLQFGGDALDMFATGRMDPLCRKHFDECIGKLPADLPCAGVGLWVDGVPCNWDRTESLEVCV